MFCANCGSEVKEGAKFCGKCGANVDYASMELADSGTYALEIPAAQAQVAQAPATQAAAWAPATPNARAGYSQSATPDVPASFAQQMESDSSRSRKKLSPLMILVLVLTLLAGTALAAVVITQQAGESGSFFGGAQPSASVSASEQPARELTDEEKAIKALDGWWLSTYHHDIMGFQDTYGDIHDGKIDWYRYDPTAKDVAYSATVDITKAERFAENGAEGWRFFTNTSTNDEWAYYQTDDNKDDLPIFMVANGYNVVDSKTYNMFSPERYGMSRLKDSDPRVPSELFAKAQKLAAQRGEGGENASEASSAASAPVDLAAMEAQAVKEAEDAGKTVLTGTVFIGTEADWAAEEGLSRPPNPGSYFNYVGLILDEPVTVTARDYVSSRTPYRDCTGPYVWMGSNYNDNAVDLWSAYEGQRVTVAFSEFETFSDSLGALFAFRGRGAERIAPLTEEDVAAREHAAHVQEKAQQGIDSADGYVLPDSSTREYSQAELEKLDVHTLFLARNEIFARHGRQFVSEELQQYFGSKSWYKGTIPAGEFDNESLSSVEKANVDAMGKIERSRNSPYL